MHHYDPAPVPLDERRIVGHLYALSCGLVMSLDQSFGAKALGSLNAPEMSAIDGLVDDVTLNPLECLVQRRCNDCSLSIRKGGESSVDHLGGNEGSRRVMNDHVVRGDMLKTVMDGLLPAVTTCDDEAPLGEGGSDAVYKFRRNDENDGIASEGGQDVDGPVDQRAASEFLKLLERGPARSLAASARRDNRRNRAGSPVGYPSTSSSIFSASSSLQFFEKVNSDTRIWRALVSMRFSPADKPFSRSRW